MCVRTAGSLAPSVAAAQPQALRVEQCRLEGGVECVRVYVCVAKGTQSGPMNGREDLSSSLSHPLCHFLSFSFLCLVTPQKTKGNIFPK